MTQPELKKLVKLLEKWGDEFKPTSLRLSPGVEQESQPYYRDMVYVIRNHIRNEIEE